MILRWGELERPTKLTPYQAQKSFSHQQRGAFRSKASRPVIQHWAAEKGADSPDPHNT